MKPAQTYVEAALREQGEVLTEAERRVLETGGQEGCAICEVARESLAGRGVHSVKVPQTVPRAMNTNEGEAMSTTEQETPTMGAHDVLIVNAARTILDGMAGRAGRYTATGEACGAAERAIFNALNVAKIYGGFPLTSEQVQG